jgi:glucose 1-dehydrogenase
MGLEGKVALVTGSSRGIGRAIALRLASEGADLVVNHLTSDVGARETVDQIEELGRRALAIQGDVRSTEDLARMFGTALEHFGSIDILVNNAGVERKAAFTEVTEEQFDQVIGVNLRGVFFATQLFVRHLLESERPGKVIHVSSVHEDLPFPGFASYCASKGGVRMLTRTLAVELRGKGITVNAVAPGAIATSISRDLLAHRDRVDALVSRIPLGHIGTTADVAGVVAFLASSDADYVTGATYFVDGGLSIEYEEK